MGLLVAEKPVEFQGVHEESDTLIAFHVHVICAKIMVRLADKDVHVILAGIATKMPPKFGHNDGLWIC